MLDLVLNEKNKITHIDIPTRSLWNPSNPYM